MKEYILCAAIHYKDYGNQKTGRHLPKNIQEGIVICGRRHHNCINTFFELTGVPTRKPYHIQGFLTNTDRFVDRKEAYFIAKDANQLLHSKSNPTLKSEDLY
jgi:hypothetical protein